MLPCATFAQAPLLKPRFSYVLLFSLPHPVFAVFHFQPRVKINATLKLITRNFAHVQVTWTSGKEDILKGCLGTMRPTSFVDGLQDMAIKAGSKDSRFQPISLTEFPSLTCGVSILSPMKPCLDWQDWEVGTHGIVLYYDKFSATYLPEVAHEQGWTKKETLESLARKAGFKLSDSLLPKISVSRYSSSKAKATHQQWKDSFD